MTHQAHTALAIPPEGIRRVIIKNVVPSVENGAYPAKAAVSFPVCFAANIFADGHDRIVAVLQLRFSGEKHWQHIALSRKENDLWQAVYRPEQTGLLEFRIQAWVSGLESWKDGYAKKQQAGVDTILEELGGVALLQQLLPLSSKSDRKILKQLLDSKKETGLKPEDLEDDLYQRLLLLSDKSRVSTSPVFRIRVDRKKAQFSTWYELFPRSCAPEPGRHGTFGDVIRRLPALASAGFDVLYLPPIHPIGRIHRKGRNNSLAAGPADPGSPWAIGSDEGGHKALHPELGTMADFKKLVREAGRLGIEIAMDIAFQCAPDHPYVHEHPEWFRWRADGTVQFAENPPKKYEDILPFDFESAAWQELWQELLSIFMFWIGKGIRIFRVDNPHTKSLRLWEWIIGSIQASHPDVLFLSEAFTRQHIMEHLAMIGFSQSYTYFTWRNTRQELQQYMTELSKGPKQFFFRPNFWPNTPDILPAHLVTGGVNMHIIRLLLAATLSSNYGLYGPVYERGICEPAPGKEEYTDNEKYEIRYWEPEAESRTWSVIRKVNQIRHTYEALQVTNNIEFLSCSNDAIMAYLKWDPNGDRHLLVVICLDPHYPQSGWIQIPREKLFRLYGAVAVEDLLQEEHYDWNNDWNYVALDPHHKPAHLFRFRAG